MRIIALAVLAVTLLAQDSSILRNPNYWRSCTSAITANCNPRTDANGYLSSGLKGPIIACAAAPGDTVGLYGSLCEVRATGALWACTNAAGCTVAANWTAAGGGGGASPYSCAIDNDTSTVCTHNLNTSQPWVTCYDASGNMIGGASSATDLTDVVATSANIATLTFSGAEANRVCVISTGSIGPKGDTGATGATGPAGSAIHSLGATLYALNDIAYVPDIPFACTVDGWSIAVTGAGTATVDIARVAGGTTVPAFPGDSITAAATPAIAADTRVRSTTMTGWCGDGSCEIAVRDQLAFKLTAVNGPTAVAITVTCQ